MFTYRIYKGYKIIGHEGTFEVFKDNVLGTPLLKEIVSIGTCKRFIDSL